MSADVDLHVRIGALELPTPIMPASGCFGPELGALVDLDRLGALVTKTIFFEPRAGNPAHRLGETAAGMLNSVGIPSIGVERFLVETLPRFTRWSPPTIVSIGGLSVEEYWRLAERLADVPEIDALELNISCPNLEAGGHEIGADPRAVEAVVSGVRRRTSLPIIVKLTPNVTSIVETARAAEGAGADALSAVNALLGMSADARRGIAPLGTVTGGLTGPAIKPVAQRAVLQVVREVSIPVIGVGGIASIGDLVEYLLIGATAVQVGSATFTHPDTMLRLTDELAAWMRERGHASLDEIRSTLDTGGVRHELASGVSRTAG
ncbi:MAG TPA: dihydroorotate dehydrogenase [Candidatus Limnocylindria bacterium]|nr:dihydroorotate dehydrogenase [Candidatus Limnocylindria bacterium]